MGNQHLILLSNCKGNQVSFGGDGKYDPQATVESMDHTHVWI